MITVEIPGLKLASEANDHHFWRGRHTRSKEQRGLVMVVLRARLSRADVVFPIKVTITRIAPRALDTDNLAGSAKHVRDAIAEWLGVDDGVAERDNRVLWVVEQRQGKPRFVGVEIRIEARKAAAATGATE